MGFYNFRREVYSSPKELAARICNYVADSGIATLATDFRWWAKGYVSPYKAYIPDGVLGYNIDLDEYKLVKAIQSDARVKITLVRGQSSFYRIDRAERAV